MGTSGYESISLGFSSIYEEYEYLSEHNFCDICRRKNIRNHVESFLKAEDSILEINAGSGIDAVYFAQKGHSVLATDIAEGAKILINKKIEEKNLNTLYFEQCSFNELTQKVTGKFNYLFSNYGGLNCTNDLEAVFSQFGNLLHPNGFVTLVIMPKYYPWEMATVLKGNKKAFRRWNKKGTMAKVNDHVIPTYYYSPKEVERAMGSQFKHIATKNIGTFYPSLHFTSLQKHKKAITLLMQFDTWINAKFIMPKGVGDYFIITFQKK